MNKRGLDIFLLILKILIPVALVLYLGWATIDLVDMHLEDIKHVGENGYFSGYGLSFAALMILGFMFNGVVLVLSLIGLIISICYKKANYPRRNVATFILLMIAPIVAELLLVLIGNLIPGIVG